ncbi:MAG: hypothetical protein KDH09_11105, partial [Chrysiogenetes bacterium]|nr:hypothetical protein [Chrysiogenetes bacterium]
SFTANATLEAHALEITEFVATGTGIRVTGGGHLNLAPSYEESSIDFTLEVARSKATTQPVLAQAYAGLAQTNSYQVGLHGSLARPQVLINGFPMDPAEGPVVLPAGTPGSVHSPTSRRATARPHAKDRSPHTTRGGAQGHARGRAPLPWPSDSPQAQRFEELWAAYQLEFETLADEGQTVRGLTRKQLKRQVIDQVREEFAESVEQ